MTGEQKKTYEEKRPMKTIQNNKMAVRTYLSMITLNVNGLNASAKRHRLVNGYKNKAHKYAVCKRTTSDLGHIQTESERMGKGILCKWKSEESWSSSTRTHTRQNRLAKNKGQYIMIKGSTQEGVTVVNNICTQHRNTSI